MKTTKALCHRHWFPGVVISCAVRRYFRFQLSLRDIEELLLERVVKQVRTAPETTWHLDEVFDQIDGEPYLLWRAVDQHGAELDILVQKRRDTAAAKRFFQRLLAQYPNGPRKIVTGQLRSYPAAKAELSALAGVEHVFVKAAARVNNRAENSHQPTRQRERRM